MGQVVVVLLIHGGRIFERGGKNDPDSIGCQLGHMGLSTLPAIILIIREVIFNAESLQAGY